MENINIIQFFTLLIPILPKPFLRWIVPSNWKIRLLSGLFFKKKLSPTSSSSTDDLPHPPSTSHLQSHWKKEGRRPWKGKKFSVKMLLTWLLRFLLSFKVYFAHIIRKTRGKQTFCEQNLYNRLEFFFSPGKSHYFTRSQYYQYHTTILLRIFFLLVHNIIIRKET